MYIYEKKSLKMTTLQIVFNAGALYEKAGRYGTMHLMEHTVCKTFDDMQSTLTKEGISWNAYTGDEHVVFHFTGLDSHLTPEMKRTLVSKILGNIDMVSEESFNTERSTVLQEYKDCFEDPVSCKMLNVLRNNFNHYDAIGRYEDVANFTLADAKEVKKEFFTKPARIIEVGPTKTDFSEIEYEIEAPECAKLKYNKNYNAEQEECPESDKTFVMCVSKKLVSKSDFPYLKVACDMLSSGLESPLYNEIRVKRGLSYFSRADVTPMVKDSICMLYANTTKEREDELVNVYENVLANVINFMTEERFNDIISAMTIAREKKKVLRYSHVNDLVRKDCVQMPKNLKKITFEKVLDAAQKYLNLNNIAIIKK